LDLALQQLRLLHVKDQFINQFLMLFSLIKLFLVLLIIMQLTMFDGFDFANLLVKTREGRPIKIENNTIEGAKFAANARVHASVLSLYDNMRLKILNCIKTSNLV
jgi:hypothetical protein